MDHKKIEATREGGPGVPLGGERSEPTPDQQIAQRETAPQLHAVEVFADWTSDAERPLRIRIYRARDKLIARANRSKHGRARAVYWIGNQMAADWAFWRASSEDLEEVLASLGRIFMVAQTIERLEAPDVE